MRAGLEETVRVTLSDRVGVAYVRWASQSGNHRRRGLSVDGCMCGTVMGLMGLLTCRHQRLVLGSNRAKRAQRPGEDIVGNRNFPLKGGRPAHNFHPPTSCAAPQPTRSISTKLIYDKPDLVFLSLVLYSSLPALTSPRQRSPIHSNLGIWSACIPPRRLRQTSLVSALLYPSNNPSIFLLPIPWDKLPLGLLGHHDCFSNIEQEQKEKNL